MDVEDDSVERGVGISGIHTSGLCNGLVTDEDIVGVPAMERTNHI